MGDFNGDGDPDLAVANFNSATTSRCCWARGGGSFSGPTNFAAGSGPPSVAVGDFNGDGKPDLAVASFNSDTVAVRLNTTTSQPGPDRGRRLLQHRRGHALTVNAPACSATTPTPTATR